MKQFLGRLDGRLGWGALFVSGGVILITLIIWQFASRQSWSLRFDHLVGMFSESVLYASLLEDAPADLADEGMAKCEQEFFDWNEVRVTTATELSQVLSRLPDAAATHLRQNRRLTL